MAILGVDVANVGQGNIDAGRAAPFIGFGICKATEGTGFTDPSFAHNVASVRAAARIPGAYHFLRGTSSGAAQCDHFLDTAGGDGMLLALDVEVAGAGSQVEAFLTRFVQRKPGRRILVYSNRGLWDGPADITRWPVVGWHAGYVNGRYIPVPGDLAGQWASAAPKVAPSHFGGITSFPLIQFTDHATVPGISSPCDGDAWLGSFTDLRALAGLGAPSTLREDTMTLARHPGDNAVYLLAGDRAISIPDAEVGAWAAICGQDPTVLPPINGTMLGRLNPIPATVDTAALAAAVVAALPAGTVAPTADQIAAATVDLLAARVAN